MWRLRRCGALAALLALQGCASLGPTHIAIDRSDYAGRLRDSEKNELLANLVALRFGDAPLFLSVTSVISQYTRERTAKLDIEIKHPSGDPIGDAEGDFTFRETPTVTYTPMSGERLAHSLLAPMPPAALFGMIEAGWASDDLFRMTVRSINGIRNTSDAPLFAQPADAAFDGVVAALRRLQAGGALTVRVAEKDKAYSAIGHLRPDLSTADLADLDFLRRQLGLEARAEGLKLTFAAYPADKGELALTTRSMLQVLMEMSRGVDLAGDGRFDTHALVRIHSGAQAPADAHAAVKRRGRWFWIAGDDEASKRAFLLAQVLMSLNDSADGAKSPVVTIPAG